MGSKYSMEAEEAECTGQAGFRVPQDERPSGARGLRYTPLCHQRELASADAGQKRIRHGGG